MWKYDKTGMTISRNWDNDGALVIRKSKTIRTYKTIKKRMQQYHDPCIFWAFDEQDIKNKKGLAWLYNKDEEFIDMGGGMYATKSALEKRKEFFAKCKDAIREKCDPQEVYCYEFNNYEAFISFEHDAHPIGIVRDIWGADIYVKRF